MARRTRHHWPYWFGAAISALVVGFAGCFAGIGAYNRDIERERIAVGISGFVDGRMPLELPLYAAVGAFVGWCAFRLVIHYLQRDRRTRE